MKAWTWKYSVSVLLVENYRHRLGIAIGLDLEDPRDSAWWWLPVRAF